MRVQPQQRAGRVVWVVVAFALSVAYAVAVAAPAFAAGTAVQTQARLNVNPVDCTVDIVDDGTGQTLQIPASSCLPIVPEILTPVLDQGSDQLPVNATAGETPPIPVIIVRPNSEDTNWSPVALATTTIRQSPAGSVGAVTTMVGGVGIVAAVTAVGVDGAIFELRHSRSVTRWVRGRLGSLYPGR